MTGDTGQIVFLSDDSENIQKVSTIGRGFFAESFPRIKNHSPINVTAASGGSTFESVAVSKIYLRSASGNQIMWWGGTDEDAPYSGRGFPLYGGETTPPIPVTNFSALQVVAAVSGQIVYPIGFLNGTDITLSNQLPVNPFEQDTTAPQIVSHTPVSGATGVARDSNIVATFNESIAESSLVSGVYNLSPAFDVTFYVDSQDPTMIVLDPVGNLASSTSYNVEITTGLTDLAGNHLSGAIRWPFKTAVAAPGPDTSGATVTSTTPASGASSIAIETDVTIVFSESMLSGTVTNTNNIYLSTTSGAAAPGVAASLSLNAADQKTVTLNPTNSLAGGQQYWINVLTGCQDLAGNPLQTIDRERNFTTVYNFQEIYNITGGGTGTMFTGDDDRIGTVITGTCDLKDAKIKRIVYRFRKNGSPTGTIFVRIRKGSDDNDVIEFGSISASSLTTSYIDYTFTNLSNEYTCVVGDYILAEYSGGNASNLVEMNRNTGGDSYPGADYVQHAAGSYNPDNGKEIAGRIYK